MIKVSGERDQINIAKVYKAGQEHILRFWDELDYEARKKLLAQIDRIDFQLVTRLVKSLGADKAAKGWYNYSKGLRDKGGVWTEQDLDAFLEDANKFAPGSTKSIRVSDSVERKAIIDFLKKLQ